MKAVSFGFVFARARTSGSVRKTYPRNANASAAAAAIVRASSPRTFSLASHYDFDSSPDDRPRIGLGAVHDRQRGGLDHAAGTLGNRLPGITRAHRVDVDSIGMNGRSLGGAERLEGTYAREHCGVERVEDVWRTEAGDQVHVAIVNDVRGAHPDVAEPFERTLVQTNERVEAVHLIAAAAQDPKTRILHLRAGDVLDAIATRHLDLLEQHIHVRARRLRNNLLGTVLNVPTVREVDPETERRVNERGAADDPLIWIVAVDDAVHRAKHRVAIANQVRTACGQLLDRRLDFLHAGE